MFLFQKYLFCLWTDTAYTQQRVSPTCLFSAKKYDHWDDSGVISTVYLRLFQEDQVNQVDHEFQVDPVQM